MRSATSTCPIPRRWAAPGRRSRWAPRPGSGNPGGADLLALHAKERPMLGHHSPPSLQHDHALYPAMRAAAAAMIVLALAACSSAGATASNSAATPTMDTFGSGGHKPTLTG